MYPAQILGYVSETDRDTDKQTEIQRNRQRYTETDRDTEKQKEI